MTLLIVLRIFLHCDGLFLNPPTLCFFPPWFFFCGLLLVPFFFPLLFLGFDGAGSVVPIAASSTGDVTTVGDEGSILLLGIPKRQRMYCSLKRQLHFGELSSFDPRSDTFGWLAKESVKPSSYA